MPNRRAQGIVVRSYSVDEELHAAAAAKAAAEGRTLTEVIRQALAHYLAEDRVEPGGEPGQVERVTGIEPA
ncbi:ribbon-helix-helix protein, CopG family [Nocardioides massiliensis]|uniref:ribbon-helix-helix protein, CopG family n=1 Tax=Nocardioides massiliensis TaxID=1325935 RepID=UPI0015EB4771|nr:ribbon-helix-helix protein, CopG family [Nocardioides massiliensis]